ncbi:relaxin-3a [Periophthalmus magnuspinnatus]|uniref:Relaxin-3 n=1 Tax=Periophthalmus magnuspinnatus TaxID=409849 RepID=A0A3B4BIS7_9GOBI|nr:relaxin-3a [Periophthalmus magnuspinnatus]
MWKAILLMVCLLVAGVQPIENPVYGVKLCGREFIRAVIFTCGGSRWKRSLMSTDVLDDSFSSQDYSTEGLPQNSAETILQRNKDSAFTSKDSGNKMFTRQARSFISDEILEALRKADRKGRDLVLGLSSACCKWGCSKSEISSLC